MSTSTLTAIPKPLPLYLKAARSATRKPRGVPEIPPLSTSIRGQRVDAQNLEAYNRICGFTPAETLPITYPQIIAAPLHIHLMTQKEFPLPLLGIVHVRNLIEQGRPLRADESFDIQVRLGDSRTVRAGLEFDLHTEFTGDGTPAFAWRAVTTVLYRIGKPDKKAKPPAAPLSQLAQYRSFDAPADIGRRYAKVCGDYNPIHLYALTARIFGFPRAIAHGMWSLARSCALVQPSLAGEPKRLEVSFKQPLLLPGKVAVKFNVSGDAAQFALLSRSSDKVHLTGSLS